MGMGSLTGIVAILCIFGIPIIAIICGTIIKLREQPSQPAEDTRMIQEIHQGLSRMEERIEALETILFDRNTGRTDS